MKCVWKYTKYIKSYIQYIFCINKWIIYWNISLVIFIIMRSGTIRNFRGSRIKHFMFNIFFPWKSCRLWQREKYMVGRDRAQITLQHFASRITRAADTQSAYVVLIAFPRQWSLHESALVLCLYVHCLSSYYQTSRILSSLIW